MTSPVPVLIVDHQPVFGEALAARLGWEADLEVVGAVSRPLHALALVPTRHVRVVLLEQWLGESSGLQLARRLRGLPDPPEIVVLGDADNPSQVVEALRAGVRGWVGKDSPFELLTSAVRAAARRETWLAPLVLGPVVEFLLAEPRRQGGSNPPFVLTRRELDVLRCIMEGLDQNAMARRLFMSLNTVRTHRRRVFAKMGVHSSLEAVAMARRAGLGGPTD